MTAVSRAPGLPAPVSWLDALRTVAARLPRQSRADRRDRRRRPALVGHRRRRVTALPGTNLRQPRDRDVAALRRELVPGDCVRGLHRGHPVHLRHARGVLPALPVAGRGGHRRHGAPRRVGAARLRRPVHRVPGRGVAAGGRRLRPARGDADRVADRAVSEQLLHLGDLQRAGHAGVGRPVDPRGPEGRVVPAAGRDRGRHAVADDRLPGAGAGGLGNVAAPGAGPHAGARARGGDRGGMRRLRAVPVAGQGVVRQPAVLRRAPAVVPRRDHLAVAGLRAVDRVPGVARLRQLDAGCRASRWAGSGWPG